MIVSLERSLTKHYRDHFMLVSLERSLTKRESKLAIVDKAFLPTQLLQNADLVTLKLGIPFVRDMNSTIHITLLYILGIL